MEMIQSKLPLSIQIQDETDVLKGFKGFLNALLKKVHSNSNPGSLSMAELASEFDYTIDEIKEFLEIIKLNFELYQSLNRNEPVKQEQNAKSTKLKMSIKQLQILSDFHYISSKFPIKSFVKHVEFAKLIEEFPVLFAKNPKGYTTAELGSAIAQQVLAFKRLNTFPKSLQVLNYEISII
jgi:hypothetical protein